MHDRLPSGITIKQFEAYKMVSGEHDGLTTAEAAEKLGVTARSIERLLERMEEKMPELFPLLTKDEATVYLHYQFNEVMPDFPPEKMAYLIRSLNKKGKLGRGVPLSMLSYESYMDGKVKRRF